MLNINRQQLVNIIVGGIVSAGLSVGLNIMSESAQNDDIQAKVDAAVEARLGSSETEEASQE